MIVIEKPGPRGYWTVSAESSDEIEHLAWLMKALYEQYGKRSSFFKTDSPPADSRAPNLQRTASQRS